MHKHFELTFYSIFGVELVQELSDLGNPGCVRLSCQTVKPGIDRVKGLHFSFGMLGGIFHFYSNFERTFCKQTVETVIRCHLLWCLVWVCTICLRWSLL